MYIATNASTLSMYCSNVTNGQLLRYWQKVVDVYNIVIFAQRLDLFT